MAQQNFGFNIGGGGIADLVKAPTITPARGFSFSPTPTIRREKDPKDALKGALLGAIAPSAAGLALSGLGKIPGLEKLLYKDDSFSKDAQIDLPDTTTELPKVAEGPQGIIDALRKQRLSEIDKILPELKGPKTKTAFGNLLQQAIQYAPGLAFDDDDSDAADAYIKSVQGSSKTLADLDKLKRDAALKRSQARGTAATQVKPELDRVTVNTFYKDDNTGIIQGYQTNGLRDKKTGRTWIESRGNDFIDIDPLNPNKTVDKGKYYINETATLLDGEMAEVSTDTYQDTDTGELFEGHLRKFTDPETGQEKLQTVFVDPLDATKEITRKELALRGRNLTTYVEKFEKVPFPDFEDEDLIKDFTDQETNRQALKTMAGTAQAVLNTLMTDDTGEIQVKRVVDPNTGVVTYTGLNQAVTSLAPNVLSKTADSIGRNIKQFGDQLETLGIGSGALDSFNIFAKNLTDVDRGYNARVLIDSIDNYNSVLNDPNASSQKQARARKLVVDVLMDIQQSDSVKQAGDFGGWLSYNEGQLDNYLARTGLYGANQIRLAYMAAAAAGQTGRTLSDKDVAFFMRQMGFEDGNARQPVEKILDFVNQQVTNFDGATARGSRLNELSALENKTDEEKDEILKRQNAALAGMFKIPLDKLEKLRTSKDPKEIENLKSEIRNNYIYAATRGKALYLWEFNKEHQIFAPYSFAKEFKRNKNLINLNKYLEIFGYDILTGERTLGERRDPTSTPSQQQKQKVNPAVFEELKKI